jgi:outer membrane putative beta-barrel porin/alpha-amylase
MPHSRQRTLSWLARIWAGYGLGLVPIASLAGQGLMTTPIGFRSGLTEGAVTTRPGTLTVDAGTSVRWAGGTTTYRVGELNLRAPLGDRLEARVYVNSYGWRRTPDGTAGGREDVSLAMAAMLARYRGWRPVTTVIVRLETPTGSLPARAHSWRPSGRMVFGWELPGRIALHSNLGIAREASAGRDYSREFASLWLARHLAGPVGAYGELFGATRERRGGPSTGYVHGGFTFLIRPWMHADVHGGLGSRSAGAPRWIGVGIRQRVPW